MDNRLTSHRLSYVVVFSFVSHNPANPANPANPNGHLVGQTQASPKDQVRQLREGDKRESVQKMDVAALYWNVDSFCRESLSSTHSLKTTEMAPHVA
jgi:hypothetical protein